VGLARLRELLLDQPIRLGRADRLRDVDDL
jgi:hypothetical protein